MGFLKGSNPMGYPLQDIQGTGDRLSAHTSLSRLFQMLIAPRARIVGESTLRGP